MLGAGLKDELREIGRDVAASIGSELKGVAKDKATSFVKEQFGLGFKEELQSAGREILGSVGDQLKGAAKDHVTAMIKEQLGMGYGGNGIARPCSISAANLRKAVTAARKANHVTGKATREQLMELGEGHADLGGKHAAAVVKYLERSPLTVPMLREMRGLIKGAFHRPVGELAMDDLVDYVFWTAKDLGWSWSQLDAYSAKRRQSRGCRGSAAPGRSREAPVRKKRAPSKYNLFIARHMRENPGDDARERFTDAVDAWKRTGKRRAGATKAAATRRMKRDVQEQRRQSETLRVAESKKAASARARARAQTPRAKAIAATRIPRKSERLQGRGAADDSGSDDDM